MVGVVPTGGDYILKFDHILRNGRKATGHWKIFCTYSHNLVLYVILLGTYLLLHQQEIFITFLFSVHLAGSFLGSLLGPHRMHGRGLRREDRIRIPDESLQGK